MDVMVLCLCGHPSGLHSENGCRAGRYRPCACLLDIRGAVESAVFAVRTPSWREDIAKPKRSELHK
jgi:hypothetical protein